MQRFYVDPTTYESAPIAKGFGNQSLPDTKKEEAKGESKEESNIQLDQAPGQANISFTNNIKIERAVQAEQRRREKAWEAEHKASTAAIAAQTEAKKQRNFAAREGVYSNFWHKPVGSLA